MNHLSHNKVLEYTICDIEHGFTDIIIQKRSIVEIQYDIDISNDSGSFVFH